MKQAAFAHRWVQGGGKQRGVMALAVKKPLRRRIKPDRPA
jgi:hypothetical protein